MYLSQGGEVEKSFDVDGVDVWSDEVGFDVTRESILAYAAATNDPSPRYAEAGIAPPVYAVVPVWQAIHGARDQVVSEAAGPYVLHGSQDIHIHSPLRAGDAATSRGCVVGVHPKSSGTIVTVQTRTEAGGELRNEQYMTLFYRGVEFDQQAGELAPAVAAAAGDLGAEASVAVDADQTYRYADASTDRMPIHLDDEVARKYGLPGIIVHGLCTMAMSTGALVDAVDLEEVERVSRVAVRFSHPLTPDQRLTVRYAGGDGGYGFEAEDAVGEKILTAGRLETR
jgi:acyl dehydratase